tara:strand:- start:16910 stop:17518 length:609 start_codon:yes stop_codon:yes gene_type:complete
MSKGSYIGGGTLLHGGSALFRKSKERCIPSNFYKEKDKRIAKSYYKKCLKAQKNGLEIPCIPNNEALQKAILEAEGVDNWIKKTLLIEFSLKKKTKKTEKKKPVQTKDKNNKQLEESERRFIKSYIWAEMVGRPLPLNIPRHIKRKLTKQSIEIHDWIKSHISFDDIFEQCRKRRAEQLLRMKTENSVVVEKKKSKRKHGRS